MGEYRLNSRFPLWRTKDSIKLSFFLCVSRNFRDYIDNPSKPPFDKGGFAWSRKRDSTRATPKCPLPLEGLNFLSLLCPSGTSYIPDFPCNILTEVILYHLCEVSKIFANTTFMSNAYDKNYNFAGK